MGTAKPTVKQKVTNGAGLVGLVGLIAASLLYTYTPKEEGTVLVSYKDIAGIWTICSGDTYDVAPNQVASPAECQQRLGRQLEAHAGPVMQCTPTLTEAGRDYQRAAFVLNAYNIGTNGFCKSSMRNRAVQRNWVGACDALLMYDKARVKGVVRPVRGLTLRRKREREICLTTLVSGKTPANLKARLEAIK